MSSIEPAPTSTQAISGALVRIAMRYIAGGLVAKGIFGTSSALVLFSDPEVEQLATILVGLALTAISEAWYALAKKYGWPT